jgi:hypothetical protein
VLCEGLFMTLPDQEAALRTKEGQELYAKGVYDGIVGVSEKASTVNSNRRPYLGHAPGRDVVNTISG